MRLSIRDRPGRCRADRRRARQRRAGAFGICCSFDAVGASRPRTRRRARWRRAHLRDPKRRVHGSEFMRPRVSDTRVERAVGEVDQQIDGHEEQRDAPARSPCTSGKSRLLIASHHQPARGPASAKMVSAYHRPAQQLRQTAARAASRSGSGRSCSACARGHAPLSQPLGARCADVVLAAALRACSPARGGPAGRGCRREADGGQHEVRERAPPYTGSHRSAPPKTGDQRNSQPEDRDRLAGHGAHHRDPIDDRAALHRRHHARRAGRRSATTNAAR